MAFLLKDSLIKSSSIEQVVAPVAAHICYLKLLCEADDTTGRFIQLEASARAVAEASRNMTDVASRVMAESDDEVMRSEMGLLLEPLMMSGQHVLLATQKLSIQPEVRQHREELVEATQNVLLWVVKVLLVEDDATVRKITTAAHWLLECLKSVGDATDMPSLLNAFQVFSKALMLLHNLVMNRVGHLRDHRQQDGVKTSVEILRRSVSMLNTATYTSIKHPTSQVAQKSKKYILHLVTSTVHDLILTLESRSQSRSTGSCGYYADRRVRMLTLLSDPVLNLFKDRNFDVVVRDLVFHSMSVANCSERETRSCVMAKCKRVLELWSEMRQITCTDEQEAADLQEKLRVSLIIQIHELDEAVVEATLHQVTDTFVTTSGPLEQLVNTVRNLFEADLEDGLDLDPIHTSFQTFVSSADRMAEVSCFVSALAPDEKSLESVENSVSCLVRIKEGLVPLLLELEGDSVQYHGALHKLITFHQKWEEETEHLLNSFCDVINVKDFVQISVQEMKRDSDQCVKACKSHDLHILSKHLSLLMGRMSQVLQCVRRRVDKSDDPIYRNGLLVLVKQAEKSLAEVTGYATDIFNANFQGEAFLSAITEAIKNVEVLHEGLDGLQHPHLLSPLREEARQLDSTTPVPYKEEPKKTTNNQAETEDIDHGDEDSADRLPEKKNPESTTDHHPDTKKVKRSGSKSAQMSRSTDLLPLLYEVVNTSRNKNVEALNIACTRILEMSACYTQATKEATSIVEENDHQEMESIRSELVTLTPLLIQTAQETAMSSVRISDTVYKHSTQFSDLIRSTHHILLPVTGMWYHTIKAMIQSHTANMVVTCHQELSEVMCLCADTIELATSADIKVRSAESVDSITSLLSKLQKAQNNTKNLTDLLVSKSSQSDEFDGPCILWALSIQVLLTSLDRVLGTGTPHGKRRNQMTPKKWFATMSENSLRIQEAARLSSLNCRDSRKAKLLKERDNVKALTEVYLQATDDLRTVSGSGVLKLARSELLQRQLQMKIKSLCCILSEVNEEYVPAVQYVVSSACSAVNKKSSEEIRAQFDGATEFLLRSVKTTTESVQECLHFIRDPRERSGLRFISDHLSFQVSEIVSMAKLIMETQTVCETLSVDVQTQCWAAKARYLIEELYKVDGIFPVTKEHIKLSLQGKARAGVLQTDIDPSSIKNNTNLPGPVISDETNPDLSRNKSFVCYPGPVRQRGAGVPMFSSLDPSLTYTSLNLKQEAERWDVHTNQIVKVTREMADKIYDMTRYLKRKGPIQSKEAFVSSAKELILSCQTVSLFVKLIAEHCLDQHSTKELCIIAERIITITNQLTIISRGAWCLSSVNAVTPACKSSDEILVKNAQNLLQTVIQGVRAAETACIKGLRQPEPNSEAAKAASLCIEWKKNLLIHRTQEQLNLETDDLGLRKTPQHHATPSLAPPNSVLER